MADTNATPKKPKRKGDWKPSFIEALEACPDVTAAAKHAGIDRGNAYKARQADEAFAVAWHEAINRALDDVESALIQRAKDKDTTAAIFLLKSHRPAVYGDRQEIRHSGSVAQDLSAKSKAEFQDLAAGLVERRANAA